ncbi:MAG: L-lysine 6-transaminase [Acidobacteria bacterium]|nr:L-lysine 6-transaminase [Acidobacteriota bacterium]
MSQRLTIAPQQVHETLATHMLADGYDIVMDLDQSQGSWLFDAKRNERVLDFFSNFASMPIGYNHPSLDNPQFRDRIATAALNKPANSDLYTTQMAEFVETFARVAVPSPFNKHMFFIEGGALAVENALKAAFDWKVRKNLSRGLPETTGSRVLHLKEAFHGRTGYTLSLTNTADPRKTQYFPKFDWPRIDNPKMRFPMTERVTAEVAAAEQKAIAQAKAAITEHPNDIAALILEPIQGEGGDNHFRPEFMKALRQLCDENEIILIFDEIQTGLGLTGTMWAFQQLEVEPDMFCFGKKTQVCGFASNERIFDIDKNVFTVSSRINSTWGGNLTDMVRSQRYLEVIDEENLVENAASVGKFILDRLAGMAGDEAAGISNVRGRGLMIAFDLASGEQRDQLLEKLEKKGLLVLGSGERSIRFRPHLIVTEEEASEALVRLEQAIG